MRSIDPVSGSKLEDAVKYALNQEKYLRAFLNNGEVEISNNFAENAIRPFVIGRKNWLFSDTVKGAKSSAIVYSLIETAKANSVEPYSYLALVLTDMQYMGKPFSNEELESLMPWSEEMKQSIVRRTKPTSSSDE
ncbi:MAG: transposase [Ruminococcus sp.]